MIGFVLCEQASKGAKMSETIDFPPITETASEARSTSVAPVASSALAKPAVTIKEAAIAHLRAKEPAILALAEKYRAVALPLGTPKELNAGKAVRLELRESGRFGIQRDRDATKDLLNSAKKDVEAEADRLIAIVKPVEDHVHAQIEAREAVLAAEKAERERIAAERAAGFRAKIASIRACVDKARGIASARVAAGIEMVEAILTDEAAFAEFADEATQAKAETLTSMRALFDAAQASEDAAAAREVQRVEQERIAEANRIESARLQEARDLIAKAEKEAADKLAAERAEFEREKAEHKANQNRIFRESAERFHAKERGDAIGLDKPATVDAEQIALRVHVDTDAVAALDEFMPSPVTKTPDVDTRPPINLGAIKERLGFALPRDFIEGELGISASHTVKSSVFWPESSWLAIKTKLIAHIASLA